MNTDSYTALRPAGVHEPKYETERQRFFKERGWIVVDSVLTRAEAEEAGAEGMRIMTEGTTYKPGRDFAKGHANPDYKRVGQKAMDVSRYNPIFRRIVTSPKIGAVIREVTGLPSVRLFGDQLILKLPETDNGIATGYHQDLPYYPIDRGGGATMWIAFEDLPGAAGTLRFVDGSHHRGPLGRMPLPGWLASHPEDEKLLTRAPALAAGSATIHDHLMVHGTDPNRWDRPRFGYMITFMPADAKYNGMPSRWTDGLGLEIEGPFDHEYFPVVG